MAVIGIDPGLSGAAALVDDAGRLLDVFDLPVVGDGPAAIVDGANLARFIRAVAPDRAVVELVSAMPKQGAASTFKFGRAVGVILGVLAAVEIPVVQVAPTRWKKAMRLDREKETSRLRAIETWPAAASEFARKRDHDRAEAALLALWAMREVAHV